LAMVLLSARSDADAVAARASPSPETVASAGAVAGSTPESASKALQWTTTSPRYHPAAFGAVVAAPLSVGGVVSTLMPSTVVEALLPAASTRVTGRAQSTTPESASSQANDTVPGAAYQPAALAARSADAATRGAVLSRLTETLAEALLPAASRAVPTTSWLAPSVKTS